MKPANINPAGQSELGVVKTTSHEVARPSSSQTFDIEGVFRYAIDKGGGPEIMTTLMNIRRELNAEAAKKAFDEALSAFQSECPHIVKGKGVPTRDGQIAYKYAPIEQVESVIRPIELKHGFSHTFDQDVTSQTGFVIASCIVTHVGGASRTATVKFPLGTKTGIMSDTQVYASALSFANRRALSNAYGLVLVGEDFDGGQKPKPSGPSMSKPSPAQKPETQSEKQGGEKVLVASIWNLCKKYDATLTAEQNWYTINAHLKKNRVLAESESLPKLPISRLEEVLKATDKLLNG